MNPPVVVDTSAVVAALLDSGPDGQRATARLTGAELYAPTLLPFECANVFRRLEMARQINGDQAIQAHSDLIDLAIGYWPYDVLAQRIWSLRKNLSCHDAAYVALCGGTGRDRGDT